MTGLADALMMTLNNGFVVVNAETEQVSGTPDFGDNDTMGFYTQDDLPFYYQLAQTFAMNSLWSITSQACCTNSFLMSSSLTPHLSKTEWSSAIVAV